MVTSFSGRLVVDQKVKFVHTVARQKPEFVVQIRQGSTTSQHVAGTTALLFPRPSISLNPIVVRPQHDIILTRYHLHVTDEDTSNTLLKIVTRNPLSVSFINLATEEAVNSFTVADIENGRIRLQHLSEGTGEFELAVDDGDQMSSWQQAQVALDSSSPPSLVNNFVIINDGHANRLTAVNLKAEDSDSTTSAIKFIVKSAANCHFEYVTNPGQSTMVFSQLEISSGKVNLVHESKGSVPAITFSLTDGSPSISRTFHSAVISMNEVPEIQTALVMLTEGGDVTLTQSQIAIVDHDDEPSTIVVKFTGVKNLLLVWKPTDTIIQHQPSASIKYSDIVSGRALLRHDGSEEEPQCTIQADDGNFITEEYAVSFTFHRVNDPPTISGSLPEHRAVLGELLTMTLPQEFCEDPEGTDVTFTVTMAGEALLPAWLTFDRTTRTLSGMPTESEAGSYLLNVQCTDSDGYQQTTTLKLYVGEKDAHSNDSDGDSALLTLLLAAGSATVAGSVSLGFWYFRIYKKAKERRHEALFAYYLNKFLKLRITSFGTPEGQELVKVAKIVEERLRLKGLKPISTALSCEQQSVASHVAESMLSKKNPAVTTNRRNRLCLSTNDLSAADVVTEMDSIIDDAVQRMKLHDGQLFSALHVSEDKNIGVPLKSATQNPMQEPQTEKPGPDTCPV